MSDLGVDESLLTNKINEIDEFIDDDQNSCSIQQDEQINSQMLNQALGANRNADAVPQYDEDDSQPFLANSIAPPVSGGVSIYIGFLLLGLGTLLPWNFFVTAESYWQYKFRNATAPDWQNSTKTNLQNMYTPMQVCFAQITNFSFLFINALVSHRKNAENEWVYTLIVRQRGVFYGSLFGVAGMFPMTYITAVISGQALSGVFASAARVISIVGGTDDLTAAFIFFMIATAIMTLTIGVYFYMLSSPFYKHFTKRTNNIQKTMSSLESLREHIRIIKSIRPVGLSVTFVFFVTLAVFPAVCVKIHSTSSNKEWADKYFQPVITFLVFNIGDYIGRQLSGVILWPKRGSSMLYWMVILRIVFIPLFLLCNHDEQSLIPSLFTHDAWYTVIMVLFSLSNGYSAALCMAYGPRMVREEDAEKAGTMMAAMLGLGLLLGAFSSFGFALIH